MSRADWLTVALPKGKLAQDAGKLLARAGLPVPSLGDDNRQLLFEFPGTGLRYLLCRPTDVPTYVEYGAADLGVVGKDSLVESGADVYELADLGFGYCRFVVAVPQRVAEQLAGPGGEVDLTRLRSRRVATKFPRLTAEFFRSQGLAVEIIKLHGNIELAPLVGLAEMIVDLVSTGRTLRENHLVVARELFSATARLIANRAAYRLKYQRVQEVSRRLGQAVEEVREDADHLAHA